MTPVLIETIADEAELAKQTLTSIVTLTRSSAIAKNRNSFVLRVLLDHMKKANTLISRVNSDLQMLRHE